MTVAERRKYPRLAIGGNAEITSILNRDDLPEGRSTILNCSRGGALLRVPSPQRRMFKKMPPAVYPQDSITIVLRFPPVYQDIEVFAEVRRVTRPSSDPDSLHVGIRFFYDVQRKSGLDRHLNVLRRLLGSAAWCDSSASNDEIAAKLPGTVGVRATQPTIIQPGRAASKRVKKAASPAGKRESSNKRTSKRHKKVDPDTVKGKSKRLKKAGSDSNRVKKTSKRVKKTSERVQKTSERIKKTKPDGAIGRAPRSDSSTVRRLTIKRSDGSSATRRRLDKTRPTIPPRPTSNLTNLWERSSAILDSALFVPDAISKPKPKKPKPRNLRDSTAGPPLGLASSVTTPKIRRAPTPDPQPTPSSAFAAEPTSPAPAPIYFGLAGPESGLYIRGRGRLKNGSAVIELPDHFSQSVDPRTITVHLTPNGECYGLFVGNRTANTVTVRELGGGSSAVSFDYMVLGRRK